MQKFPLQLVANQPTTRLHSQMISPITAAARKSVDVSLCGVHPADAAVLGVKDRDIVRVHNDRGACLAGAMLDDALSS
jgi:biotin/methionine sulfoxide reductase